jgi:uncharacterized membrane protein YdbT with pleckstrin-like domain
MSGADEPPRLPGWLVEGRMTVAREASTEEAPVYQARLHWIIFAPPIALFAAGAVAAVFQPVTAIVLLLASIAAIVGAYFKYATTLIVITDRRVLYQTGFIARNTTEMRKEKIESIDVSQSVLGRLLDFGAVTVKGTGGGIEAIHNVAAPYELRRHVAAEGDEQPFMPGIVEEANA